MAPMNEIPARDRNWNGGNGGADIAEARATLNEARHLPGYIYASPELYAAEKEKIFMKDWLCVARAEEFEKPGDYQTYTIMDEPLIVVKDKDGELNAFSNICAHRGVEVVFGEGNTERFSCPYHGWIYDLQGKLVGASYMKDHEGFDPKTCRLPHVKLGIWEGWVFVNFDESAESLEDYVADFEQDFGFLRMGDLLLADKLVAELDCNWKLVVENIVDIYHIRVLHVKTNGRFLTEDGYSFDLRANGGYVFNYDSGPSTPTGEPLFGKIAWLADKPKRFSISGFLRPNFTLFGRIDDIHPNITWPLGPDKTRIVVYTLFPKEFRADPDFDAKVKEYHDWLEITLEEDRTMIASLQRAMSSKRFVPGHMASMEKGVHHVINYYLDRMFGDQ